MKRLLTGSAILAGLVLATLTTPAIAAAEPEPEPCICTMEYRPVIGTDGKTYSNACQAGCAGVGVVQEVGESVPEPSTGVPPTGCAVTPAPTCPAGIPAPPDFLPGGAWYYQVTLGSWPGGANPSDGKPSQPNENDLCPPDLPPGAVC